MSRKLFTPFLIVSLALITSTSFAQSGHMSMGGGALGQAMQADLGASGAEAFTLEDGVLSSVSSEERAFLVLAEPYGDFELSVEYWAAPETNSGIFIRCQDADAIGADSCYEVNIWDANENPDNRTGSIVHYAPPSAAIDSLSQWTAMTIRAEGGHIVVTVSGQTTADIMDETYANGHIGLQYGGGNGTIKFRNLEISAL